MDDDSQNKVTPVKRRTTRKLPASKAGVKRMVNRNSVADLIKLVSLEGIRVEDGRTAKTISNIQEDDTIQPREASTPIGHQSLTAKQEGFALDVAKGMTLSGAYRANYAHQAMSDKQVWQEASLLAKNPKVTARIKALDNGLKPKAQHDPAEVKQAIIKTLREILDDSQAESKDRMKAAELLGRWGEVALFEEHATIKVETSTPEVAIEQLRDRLKKMGNG